MKPAVLPFSMLSPVLFVQSVGSENKDWCGTPEHKSLLELDGIGPSKKACQAGGSRLPVYGRGQFHSYGGPRIRMSCRSALTYSADRGPCATRMEPMFVWEGIRK